jgi:DNA-binding transcriptional regulator of glucitol operon
VRRVLLSPRWLLGHALVICLALVCLRLGWWQWDRAHGVGGSMQNYGYALQWPLFAACGVWAWVKICQDAVRQRPRQPQPRPSRRRPVPPPQPAPPISDEDDPELAAYNRYLARLNGLSDD